MAGFLAFARQRVFPGGGPSDVLVRCTQKAITVAGTAPVSHRIPSLPKLSASPFKGRKKGGYHHLRCKVTNKRAKYQRKVCFSFYFRARGVRLCRLSTNWSARSSTLVKVTNKRAKCQIKACFSFYFGLIRMYFSNRLLRGWSSVSVSPSESWRPVYSFTSSLSLSYS